MEPKFDSGELFKVVDQPLDEPINIGFYKPCQNSIDMVRRFRSMILGENTTPNKKTTMEQMKRVAKIADLYNEISRLNTIIQQKDMVLRRVVFDFTGFADREMVFQSFDPLLSLIPEIVNRRIAEIETELNELLQNK